MPRVRTRGVGALVVAMSHVLGTPCALATAQLAFEASARADAPFPTAEERQLAHAAFEQGRTAFDAHDYLRAAALFVEAYRHIPHHDTLWNAARAFELGGEETRAANLYSRYLQQAPEGARDRDRATTARTALAQRLGRVEIVPSGATGTTLDSVPVDPGAGTTVFVSPGDHLVAGTLQGAPVARSITVNAGDTVSVSLAREVPAVAPSAPASTGPDVSRRPTAERATFPRVLPPTVFWVGLGLTAAAGGITLWQGLSTVSAKKAYERAPSTSLYDTGQGRESRTNAFFWTTVGLGAVAAACGLVFTRWHHGKEGDARTGLLVNGDGVSAVF